MRATFCKVQPHKKPEVCILRPRRHTIKPPGFDDRAHRVITLDDLVRAKPMDFTPHNRVLLTNRTPDEERMIVRGKGRKIGPHYANLHKGLTRVGVLRNFLDSMVLTICGQHLMTHKDILDRAIALFSHHQSLWMKTRMRVFAQGSGRFLPLRTGAHAVRLAELHPMAEGTTPVALGAALRVLDGVHRPGFRGEPRLPFAPSCFRHVKERGVVLERLEEPGDAARIRIDIPNPPLKSTKECFRTSCSRMPMAR